MMLRKIFITLPVLLLLFSSAQAQDLSERVKAGQSKEEIRKEIGDPARVIIETKSSEYIWGPEEAFWSEIPMGTELEVWRYENNAGQLNLYFLEKRNRLSYKAFAPAGVMY
jgi:hypothetical protein